MKTHITTLNNMAGTASLAHRSEGKGGDIAGIQNCGISYLPESVYDV